MAQATIVVKQVNVPMVEEPVAQILAIPLTDATDPSPKFIVICDEAIAGPA